MCLCLPQVRRSGSISDRLSRWFRSLMDGVVPFVAHPVCRYKRSSIALARKFYWTAWMPSSSIEAMQSTIASVIPFQQRLADFDADGRYRMWRGMNKFSPIAVRALTDIAVAVALGLTLVALVWLADTLHIAPTKGGTVREALRLVGNYADLPQWWWVGLYALLAGISVVFARIHPQPDRPPVEASFSLLSRDDNRA